ncbi:hypothetical protein [Antrihabitans sp. YC2-6]|uniref:hypothetical protein n=1 Tax=Antrihabitans sp. YC2-6 TaxID=2799498 RepID=UPI0018F307DF|nr:hypothetical protein [Antrihabitans sp. YC2-6]MBJ8344837.1 hypothetical protein [Antrihabitans sp. YC2-6]
MWPQPDEGMAGGQAMGRVSDAGIIDMFQRHADRMLTDEIVRRARLGSDFDIQVRLDGLGKTQIAVERVDEAELHDFAVRVRPFIPWVEDKTAFYTTLGAVMRSLTDEDWKRDLQKLKEHCKSQFEADQVIHFSRDKHGELKWSDYEMAKAMINGALFHPTEDPRIAEHLDSEVSRPFNNRSVIRLLNAVVVAVKQLQSFIEQADSAGVFHPKTT